MFVLVLVLGYGL